MGIFGETGTTISANGAKNVLAAMYGTAAVVTLFMTIYRFTMLEESLLFREETMIELKDVEIKHSPFRRHLISAYYYWPRQFVASGAWMANDFAFYGNKLQQSKFIALLYPSANPYLQQQWSILNSFIALSGYYLAAGLVDKQWYGR